MLFNKISSITYEQFNQKLLCKLDIFKVSFVRRDSSARSANWLIFHCVEITLTLEGLLAILEKKIDRHDLTTSADIINGITEGKKY